MFAASELEDIIEVENILKTGNFSVDETDSQGNIYWQSKEIAFTEAVTV